MNDLKIGLCVCYDTKNFGSQLQVLATQEMVQSLGFDYEIIRYKKKITPLFAIQSLPRLLNDSFVQGKIKGLKKKQQLKQYPLVWEKVKLRDQRFQEFQKKCFTKLSEPYVGYQHLKKGSQKYDLFLTGSDQLWLPSNLGSHFYTQEFVPDNKRKIAYAPSFGVSQIPWYQKRRTANYLKRFQYLSTREIAGQKLIQQLTGRVAPVVADPTLLLTRQQWSTLIPEKQVIDGEYIFCYLLGTNKEHRAIAENLKKNTGLKLVTIPFLDHFVESDLKFGDQQLFDVDGTDFVNLIRNARYVLTDSFHGTVFSIIYHKQFITLDRFSSSSSNSRNSRIDSLCTSLGLEQRRYAGNIMKIDEPIPFELVDQKLEQLRETSICYLREALTIEKGRKENGT